MQGHLWQMAYQRSLDRQRIRQSNLKGLLKNSERLYELEDHTSGGPGQRKHVK
jgi:hypothetical protein